MTDWKAASAMIKSVRHDDASAMGAMILDKTGTIVVIETVTVEEGQIVIAAATMKVWEAIVEAETVDGST